MSTLASTQSLPRAFQFRLATLLVATAWAGLVSLALRTPSALWSGVIAVATLLAVLLAILIIIYRTGRARAIAIGSVVFCVGYLAYLAVLAGTLSSGLSDPTTPVGGAFNLFYDLVHPEQLAQFRGGGMGGVGGGAIDVGLDDPSVPFGASSPVPVRAPAFDRRDFISICNHALACLLGIAGAIAAQVLYATRKDEPAHPS